MNHLQKQRAQREVEYGVAEKICSEIIPHLFHDSQRKAWIRLPFDDHYETLAIDSEEMADFLKREFWEQMKRSFGVGRPMPKNLLRDRLELLTSKALFDGPEMSVFLRVGEDSGVLYMDLCDEKWRTVKITSSGWEIVRGWEVVEEPPPVFFRRTQGMMPLPIPEHGGSIDELEPFLNISSDQFILVKGWLLAALRSRGPYPLMVLIGSAGSAKTSFSKMLRALVDPNAIPLSPPPRDIADLNVAALYSHVLGFDNISHVNQRLSDALCRLATGGGNVQRQYYTRQGQVRFPHVSRPIILNGITEFVTAPGVHLPGSISPKKLTPPRQRIGPRKLHRLQKAKKTAA